MSTKRCKKCQEEKPMTAFRACARRTDGRYSICRVCIDKGAQERREARGIVTTKKCKECREEKLLECFGIDKTTKDGRRTACRACRKIEGQEYYGGWTDEYKAKMREYGKKWRENNPAAYKKSYTDSMRKRKYGIDAATYEKMLVAQNRRCAICGEEEKLKSNGIDIDNLSVDHDHRTGKIRGLLCHHCNRGIGLFGEDPDRLEAAAAYLRRHQETA